MVNLQKGLVGHWTLDSKDTSNGTAYDSSAYDNYGIINGATSTTGFWDGAYNFTQSNSDYIITNNPTVSGDPPTTLSVWAKASTTNQTDWTGILSLGTDQNTNTTFTINVEGSGNNIAVHTWGNSTASVPLDDTNWHHYVGINTGNGTQKFYYDGEFIGSMNNSLSIPSEPSVIGARKYAVEDNNSQFWDGKIQDARIYNRALSEIEISALYNMRSQRATNTNQLFYEHFADGTLDGWEVNQAQIVTDRTRTAGYAAKCSTASDSYQLRTKPFGGPAKISTVTYWWQETSGGDYGSGIRFRNGNGNFECGIATDNGQWDVSDSSGITQVQGSTGYDDWTRFTTTFDWENNSFDVDLENSSQSYTGSYSLRHGKNVEYIELVDYTGGTFYDGREADVWIDSVEVEM